MWSTRRVAFPSSRSFVTAVSAITVAVILGTTSAVAQFGDSTQRQGGMPGNVDFEKPQAAASSDTSDNAQRAHEADYANQAQYAPAAKTSTYTNKARSAHTASKRDSSKTADFNYGGAYAAEGQTTGSTPTSPRPTYANKSPCDTTVVTWSTGTGTCRATVKGASAGQYRIVFDRAGNSVGGDPASDLSGGHAYVQCRSGQFEVVPSREDTTFSSATYDEYGLPPKTECDHVNPMKATGKNISPASVTPPRFVRSTVNDFWTTLFGESADRRLGKSSAVMTLTQLYRMKQKGHEVTMQDFFQRLLFTNDGQRVAAMAENGRLSHLFDRGKEKSASFESGFFRHTDDPNQNPWERYENGRPVDDNVADATLADRVFKELGSRLNTQWPLPSGPCTLCN